MKPGPGGRAKLGTSSALASLAAPTTGPSARRARARQRVWEKVETRARFHTNREGTKTVEAMETNADRACLGLDVHKDTITATHLGPGGKTLRTWTVPTTRRSVLALAKGAAPAAPIVLEASTAGKAVAFVLKEAGRELHMAAPNKVALIAKAPIKTDARDSAALAHLYQAGFLPECYVPTPEIDRLRTLVRARADLGYKMTRIKNQVHALVTRNLLDEEMVGISDWFGVGGIRKLVTLPLPEEEKGHLALYLQQLTVLADQEETLHAELARAAEERADVRLLMTIPGVDYYSALAIVAEIGDIRRFPTKAQLCSLAGVVPRADNSGAKVSQHRSVKRGDMVLKRFLCIAVQGMLRSKQDTTIKRFYAKKAKSIGAPKAQVAAARKLACAIWHMLSHNEAYRDADTELSERKVTKMERTATSEVALPTARDLESLGERLTGRAVALERLAREETHAG